MSASKELAVVEQASDHERAIAEMKKMAVSLSKSALIPKNLQGKGEDVWIIIQTGKELGIGPLRSLQTIHVVNGRPMMGADLLTALCIGSPECIYFRMVESTAEKAVYETQRKGHPEPMRLEYTIEQAKRAGLTGKDNWKAYTESMLRARCKSALARECYPDLVMGVYTPDEIDSAPMEATADIVYESRPDKGVAGLKKALAAGESKE